MAREKSENRIVPKGRGNAVPTRRRKTTTGGKAVPVIQEARQPSLFPDTAENPAKAGADGKAARSRGRTAMRAAPKSENKRGRVEPATIESVCERSLEAFKNVARNQGAPGPFETSAFKKSLGRSGKAATVRRQEGIFRDDWI